MQIAYIPVAETPLALAVEDDPERAVGRPHRLGAVLQIDHREPAVGQLDAAVGLGPRRAGVGPAVRQPKPGLLHHSDRGSQYASDDFQSLLDDHGIECSMSGTGNCYDNAAMESWFGLLKRERVHRRRYRTRAEARLDVFDYIERFYNRRRPHGSAGRMSPLKYEQMTLNETVH